MNREATGGDSDGFSIEEDERYSVSDEDEEYLMLAEDPEANEKKPAG